ncbi:hypothetical protein [Pontibacter anaerobius]|uniref:Uncharacterized protein n=1 Tax=Pontibacter anaerobius TaxID=2993940 RepID=A0ABT3RA49_9BACT|nr:hypothetical protein [Pontibacter anaerobius]MCX2738372.1 hypothetical protein [Pontibacter anaerobius]
MATTKLQTGEQYLIQTVDKRIALTTHRLIQQRHPLSWRRTQAVKLEDIAAWEVKPTGSQLYLGLSMLTALLVYFNESFFLLSGFFIALFFMTRSQKVHVLTAQGQSMVLPLDVEQRHINSLIDMVRQAQQNRLDKLGMQKPVYNGAKATAVTSEPNAMAAA